MKGVNRIPLKDMSDEQLLEQLMAVQESLGASSDADSMDVFQGIIEDLEKEIKKRKKATKAGKAKGAKKAKKAKVKPPAGVTKGKKKLTPHQKRQIKKFKEDVEANDEDPSRLEGIYILGLLKQFNQDMEGAVGRFIDEERESRTEGVRSSLSGNRADYFMRELDMGDMGGATGREDEDEDEEEGVDVGDMDLARLPV